MAASQMDSRRSAQSLTCTAISSTALAVALSFGVVALAQQAVEAPSHRLPRAWAGLQRRRSCARGTSRSARTVRSCHQAAAPSRRGRWCSRSGDAPRVMVQRESRVPAPSSSAAKLTTSPPTISRSRTGRLRRPSGTTSSAPCRTTGRDN